MTSFNRALQVRVADRLRAQLARDARTELPLIEGVSALELREVCEVGAGRMAAVAIMVRGADTGGVVACIGDEVRRTDVLGVLEPGVLLLLVPGLDPSGGQSLVQRLRPLLEAMSGASIGVAYRSSASSSGWTARELADEAACSAIPRRGDSASIAAWRIHASA